MTKEQLFESVVRDRIATAKDATGHSFYLLIEALDRDGAVGVARRFINPKHFQTFQDGLRELKRARLLRLSVEQTIIDFHGRGYIFSDDEADAARSRLKLIQLLVN